MGLTIPSSLTETDISLIEQTYTSTDAIIQDLESGNVPSAINPDDLILYVLSMTEDASWLDPENGALEYLWTDTSVQDALQDLRLSNSGSSEFEALLLEIEEFLDAGGQPNDAINDALDIIEKYGPQIESNSIGIADSELANLMEFFKNVNPYIYLMFYVMEALGPQVEECMEIVCDKTLDTSEDIDDLIDEIDHGDYENAEEKGELEAIQYRLTNLQEVNKVYGEIQKLLSEIVESTLELASSGYQRTSSATRTILQNF